MLKELIKGRESVNEAMFTIDDVVIPQVCEPFQDCVESVMCVEHNICLGLNTRRRLDKRIVDVHKPEAQRTSIENHILWMSQENGLDYEDLLYAAYTIENKYKGNRADELHYSRHVKHHSEHLWGIAYHAALYIKSAKMEIWTYHNPMNEYDPKNVINW